MKASIVIRTFNSERTIGKVLEHIRAQAFRDYEVVIVDSGSTDGTLEIVRRYAPDTVVDYSHGRFTYSGALNAGCDAARGEYVVCLSSHCIPLRGDWLGLLIGTLDTDERLAGAWGPLMFDANEVARDGRAEVVDLEKFRGMPTWGLRNANGVIRRVLWAERPFSEKVERCEDQDWVHHFLRRGYTTAVVHGAAVYYTPDIGVVRHTVKAYKDAMALYAMFGYKGQQVPLRNLLWEIRWFYRATRQGRKPLRASKLAISSRIGRWSAAKVIERRGLR